MAALGDRLFPLCCVEDSPGWPGRIAGTRQGAPVLRSCNVCIDADDRLLLLRAVDRRTLGAEDWRRRVVAAPQFHENHVFTATFAFNVLMGRRWPPQPADLKAAEHVCRELSLDDLLGRMPAGLFQMVGETGWQLSHGERNRLYMARALLQ